MDDYGSNSVVARAEELARLAHAHQVDKAGLPYIGHVGRVAARVQAAGHSPEAIAVAWLHDVLEDQPDHAAAVRSFPPAIVEAVELLTRLKGVDADTYYAGIRGNRLALAVKAADVADNSSPDRLALLSNEDRTRLMAKYAKAKRALGLA